MGLLSEIRTQLEAERLRALPCALPAGDPNPYAEIADDWLVHGVELIATDVHAAVTALAMAVCYGSNEAMAWLGTALIEIALDLPLNDGREMAMQGLGWMQAAAMLGVPDARDRLIDAMTPLPPDLVVAWAERPPLSHTTVH